MLQDDVQADEAEPLDTPAAFLYMRETAKRHLADPESFPNRVAMDLMLADRTPERVSLVQFGLCQIVAWRGFHPNRPFRGLGVGGLYALLWLLRFAVVRQTGQPVEPRHFLDTVDVRHRELGLDVTLYNLAPRAGTAADPERG
jgi:hypothetical protein